LLNRIDPYLLDHLEINRPDHVWTSDITNIRLADSFVFLTAVMDWFSRYVLAWKLSIFLEKEFCLTALDRALGIFLTDFSVVDKIIRHLKLTFVAEKPPPSHVFEQVALMAAEENVDYF
jgi:hypothetical protein